MYDELQEKIAERKEQRVKTIQKQIDLGDKVYLIKDNILFEGIVEAIAKEYRGYNRSEIHTSYVIATSNIDRFDYKGKLFRSIPELIQDFKENVVEYQHVNNVE